jgi:hypothetical protein
MTIIKESKPKGKTRVSKKTKKLHTTQIPHENVNWCRYYEMQIYGSSIMST